MAAAMKMKTGVLAGMAMVATFALACSQGDNQCSGQEDCPAFMNCLNGVCQSGQNDGGTVDGGTPDGGNADGGNADAGCTSLYATSHPVPCSGLNIQYVRRAVNGRYTTQDGSGIKVAVLEAAACTEWVYPVTEFCLRNSLDNETGVLPDLSTSGCSMPLDERGQCTDEWRHHDKIWLCDCNKIVSQTHDEAWPGTPGFLEWCRGFNHPIRQDCDEGGVTVEAFSRSGEGEWLDTFYKFLAHE